MKLFKLFQSLWHYMKDQKRKIILTLILFFISSLLGITCGYFSGAAVEAITNANLKLFLIMMICYFASEFLGRFVLEQPSKLMMNHIELLLIQRLGCDLFTKTSLLPAKAFEEKSSGELINRITGDTETVVDLLETILKIMIELFASFLVLFYVFYHSKIVFLEILFFIFLLYIVSKIYMPKIKKYEENIKKDNDNILAEVNQSIGGIREIRALGMREYINKTMISKMKKVFQKREKQNKFSIQYNYIVFLINVLLEVTCLITCGILVYYEKSSITFLVSMTYYIYRFMYVISSFSEFATCYQKVVVAMERIKEILDNKLYQDEKYGTKHLKEVNGEIKFQNVTFGYEKEQKMLEDFSITIPPHKKIAIVGKSGQGKTTLFNLLLRYFDPDEGMITLDDISLQDLDETSLRKHISIIRQDPFIFNKTILENFQMVDPKVSFEEIRGFCKMAMIDDYFMSLKDGYNTLIGEGGVNLSGGQKQRMAIARTLLKDGKIILFDEATSALDNESQEHIKKAMNELVKDHTIIIIAHRLSTIMDADIIYLIDQGKIIAQGTHQELIKNNKTYQNLYTAEQL